jgi:hypothetical protein
MRFPILPFCVLLMAGCSPHKNELNQSVQKPQDAAENAIGVLQKLVNEQNYRNLGFQSVEEVKQARLGQPMEIYNIGLERMKDYPAGQDPSKLLTSSAETLYPVTVGGNVRTGLTIIRKDRGYEISSFGKADIVKRLTGYRQSPGEFAVRIPALGMYFVGRCVDARVVLVPIGNDPRLKVQAGEAAPLQVVVDQLRPYIGS